MRVLNALVNMAFGALMGGVASFVVIFACTATVGEAPPEIEMYIGAATMLAGAVAGAAVAFVIWRKTGPHDEPPLY